MTTCPPHLPRLPASDAPAPTGRATRCDRRTWLRALPALAAAAWLAAPAAALANVDEVASARSAAALFLAETDRGSHGAAWDLAGAAFRSGVGRNGWQSAAEQVIKPLGALQQREPGSARATRTLPGAPDGEYLLLEYRSRFAAKAAATETVVMQKEADGQWRVVGYFIR